ncbi:MAG: VanZ family protein [Clostridia bacterium]|nr:VanZ family protein [Clostridia bacterium]
MRKIIRDFITITCLLFYIFLIFYALYHSLKSGEKSSTSSTSFTTFLKDVFFAINFDKFSVDVLQNFIRKIFGHFGLFFTIGFFGFIFYNLKFNSVKNATYLSIVVGLLISLIAEILQLFARDRNPSLSDVTVNFSGLFSAVIFMLIFDLLKSNNLSKNIFILVNVLSLFVSLFYSFFAYKSKSFIVCFLLFFITYLIYLLVNLLSLKSKARWQ